MIDELYMVWMALENNEEEDEKEDEENV